jgi:hypothetical protein
MQKQRKPQWIVSVVLGNSRSNGIESIFLNFRQAVLEDMADQLARAARSGNAHDVEIYTERCNILREATGETLYFYTVGTSGNGFEMHAQRNIGESNHGHDWYGLSLEGGHVTKATVAAFAKLVGIETPEEAIKAVGATFATYVSTGVLGEYTPCERPAILDTPERVAATA